MVDKQNDLLKGFLIAAGGAYAIYWVLTQPCVATQQVGGQVMEIGGSIAKIICLSTEPKLMIMSLIGSAATWTGASRVFRNL